MGPVALPCTSEVLQYSCQSVSLELRSLKRGLYCASDCSTRCLQSQMKELPLTFTTLSSSVSRKFKDKEHTTGPSWLTAAVENKVITEIAKAAVTPATVKKLREETGAGMMDCKKALETNDGDFEKAREFLRKKGLASAEKKSSRITAEGRIGSYIHDNRIGVLIEVNCETDFVARGEIFQQLVDDLAMQLVACQQVRFVSVESIPEEFVKKEKEIEMQKEDLLKKPEAIRGKIVEGRITKMLSELALLEQSYIKDDSILIKDLLKQTVASVGENIKVRRFERFILGEGLEKRSQDFAAEVAAQTKAS